jgi:NAD(P)-dependent dehydrogenase (short-subunit alcohol dehydrogenase family)
VKTAIVTGASSGIGKAIYEHLVNGHEFNRVIGVSRHGPDIKVDLIERTHSIFEITRVLGTNGLDCLINCAGILKLKDEVGWGDTILEVNFWAPYYLTTGLYNSLKAVKGVVINISSISGLMADVDTPIYGASKAALISLSKTLAVKYAPEVRVNCISPGFFDTNLVLEPTPRNLIDPVPLGFEAQPRMILPVVDAILNCPYMTGANIVVDGGLSCKVK